MNYGYPPTFNDPELANAIQNYLNTLPKDGRGQKPYVEINGPYAGVRIRRLTHYNQIDLDNIVNTLDAIYETII